MTASEGIARTVVDAPGRIGASVRGLGSRIASTAAPLTQRAAPFAATVWAAMAASGRVAWRTLGPLIRAVSTLGWMLAAAAVACLIAGVVLGWQELVLAGIACAALLAVASLFTLGRSLYAVRLDLASSRVVVGDRAVGRVIVRNAAKHGLLPARIELPVGASFATFHIPRLATDEERDELFTVPTNRRAVLTVGPVRSVRGDALGLLRRQVLWTDASDLFVHPRTIGLDGASAGFLRDLEGAATRVLSNSDISFHALREYVPGDDRRYVHWRTSARIGKLMVRQFEETRRSHVTIALCALAGDYPVEDGFELAVSVCGSLGLQALREEKAFSVLVGNAQLRTQTGARFLDQLSGVESEERGHDVVGLGRRIAEIAPQTSVAVLVCGSETTATQLQSAAAALPLGVYAIAVICSPGAEISRRVLGGLVILTVGALADLPRAMRRAVA